MLTPQQLKERIEEKSWDERGKQDVEDVLIRVSDVKSIISDVCDAFVAGHADG